MTAAETLAALLLLPILFACLWRARLLALAIVPPLGLALAQWFDLVDTSSASHPLRWIVPIVSLSIAMFAVWRYTRVLIEINSSRLALHGFAAWSARAKHRPEVRRRIIASVLVFASGCADIPALAMWRIPGEWALVPFQIIVSLLILTALLAPERWLKWNGSR